MGWNEQNAHPKQGVSWSIPAEDNYPRMIISQKIETNKEKKIYFILMSLD